jgi:enterochelin esterase family protein
MLMPRRHLALAIVLLGLSARAADTYTENPGTEGNGSFTIGPDYKTDPDLTDRGNPKGRTFVFKMALAESKIFPGTDKTLEPGKKPVRTERKITVYVPAAYKDGTQAPLLIIHDGPGKITQVANALDNLTISKDSNRRLPAFIAIAVENGGNDGKNSQRGLEYDTLSDRLARFIQHEVFPAVLNHPEIKAAYPGIAITDNPWGRAVMGCSSGGAAAMSMGWFRPEWFRRIIAYSGTFVDQQDDDAPEEAKYPLGAWEYHSSMKLIEKSDLKPLRIFTHVSEKDLRPNDPEETYHNWVMAGHRTEAALKAKKGYTHRYLFSLGSGHCDSAFSTRHSRIRSCGSGAVIAASEIAPPYRTVNFCFSSSRSISHRPPAAGFFKSCSRNWAPVPVSCMPLGWSGNVQLCVFSWNLSI